ncbi:hypothetical protein RvY_03226 [Ramazzottius varieornatus]|uniref:Histone-lysine N-methyltransferase n=1 Tax=Ramazzottius varieornatus TaxID=947166 RepID=A0A1D1UUC9_RAMVA|nr:hypothetical protein RvY_03226 [Ramazzottius varieornatus]
MVEVVVIDLTEDNSDDENIIFCGVSPVRPPPPLPVLSPVSNTTSRHHNGALMNERPPAIEKSPHLPSTSREDVRLVDASSTSFRSPQSADLSSPASETAVQESPVDITVSTVAVAVSRQADVEKTFSPILKGSATVREVVPQNNALLPTSPVHSDISEQPSVGSAPAVLSEPSYTSPRTESAYPAFPLSTSVPHSPTPASDSGLGSTNASIVDGTVEGASNMVPGMEASPQAENQPQTVELLSNSKASASKTLSNSKSLSAVRASSSICRKSSENVGSGSKAKVAAATLATEAEQQKSVLLEQQNIVHSVFRQHERLRNAQAFLQPSSPSSAQRLSREGSLEIADTSSTAWACSVRAKPRTRLNSEEGSFNSREEGLKTSIITTLEVTPRKLSSQELQDLNLMIKKQRKCEALLPNYQRKEPQRLLSIFPPKLLLDFKKLMEGLDKAEKKKTVECIGRVNMADVVNILKNDMSERDREMLQTIALYAARNHSKQENFMAYFALLIANDFDLNVRDKEGFSILAIAMRSGDLALVDLLLPYTAHTDLDPEGSSALHIAHQLWKADHRNMWDMVTLVLQNSTASLMFAKNNVYQTAISFFCGEQQLFKNDELETFLLEYGCDSIEAEGESLLHALAAARRVDLLSFCLGFFPFNPNRLDADHRTFMHRLAELSGLTRYEAELMMDMVRICGAQTTISDKKGLTAIDLATRCGNQEVVRLWNSYCKVANSFETGSFVGDISFGREVKAIKVVNEKSLASLKDFVYIRENIYLGEAPSLKGMMYCGCRAGQCSTTSCQCLKRGLAYSRSGTIVPGTCKGNPIFECGAHCACGPDCSSRVVQKGIRMAFEIFMTTKRGWGVRATRTIQPGEFIMEFVGEIIESDRLLARDPHNDWAMELTIDNYDGTMYHVDPTRCGNVARFLNHSCDPNLFPVRVYVSGDALDTGVRMAMFSAQVVGKGHELTFHYGDLYWQRQVDKGVYCACGSTKCKFQARKRKK